MEFLLCYIPVPGLLIIAGLLVAGLIKADFKKVKREVDNE